MLKGTTNSIWLGVIFWLLAIFCLWPSSPFREGYVFLLLLAAPLWLVPIGWRLLGYSNRLRWLGLLAALSLTIAYLIPQGNIAGLLALPWVILNLVLAFRALFAPLSLALEKLCELGALIFIVVGACWALADRIDYSPLDFDSIITLLTAVHFHYAGFILPIVTARLIPKVSPTWGTWLGYGVLAGMPLVAIGITAEHIDLPPLLESLAVTIMASAGASVGLSHLWLGWKHRDQRYGWAWLIGGMALLVGMTLALFYGWRHFHQLSFLSIPWMYAVHGTLNAIGFAVPVLLGWLLVEKKSAGIASD